MFFCLILTKIKTPCVIDEQGLMHIEINEENVVYDMKKSEGKKH